MEKEAPVHVLLTTTIAIILYFVLNSVLGDGIFCWDLLGAAAIDDKGHGVPLADVVDEHSARRGPVGEEHFEHGENRPQKISKGKGASKDSKGRA